MQTLTITNSQAPIHDFLIADIARYLTARTGLKIEFITDGSWSEREALLDGGKIDLGWICGAPYVIKRERNIALIPLAAPIMSDPRYEGRAIYFADVLARADSSIRSFGDLRGKRWVYNEPTSHSGFHLVRYTLVMRKLDRSFFAHILESGSHQNSVALILQGEADATAIDSTVWEMMCLQDPTLDQSLRTIESLGPTPMPPLVAGAHISPTIRETLCDVLVRMNDSEEGCAILARAQMARMTRVTDSDYDPVRKMLRVAEPIQLKKTFA